MAPALQVCAELLNFIIYRVKIHKKQMWIALHKEYFRRREMTFPEAFLQESANYAIKM